MKHISYKLLKPIKIDNVLEELRILIDEKEQLYTQMIKNQELHPQQANTSYLRLRKAFRYLELLNKHPHTLQQFEQLITYSHNGNVKTQSLFPNKEPKKKRKPPQQPN